MSIQVTEEVTDNKNPQLASLNHYVELANQFDLLDGQVHVNRRKDEQEVRIKTNIGGTTFTFDSISKSVRWLAVITQVAMYVSDRDGNA